MDRVIVEGVRCFHTRQSVPIKPITLLVGENSSGKTTLLALTRIAWDLCQTTRPLDFNEEPFLLGGYDQIACFRGGRGGRAKSFVIGAEVSRPPRQRQGRRGALAGPFTITGCFVQDAQPRLKNWVLDAGAFAVKIEYGEEEEEPLIAVTAPSGSATVQGTGFRPSAIGIPQFLSYLRFIDLEGRHIEDLLRVEGDVSSADLEVLARLPEEFFRSLGPSPYAFAPIRTRPQTTYEPLKEIPRPEGSHVPMILARTSLADPRAWSRLRRSLDDFGRSSGLFSDVGIRRLGRKASDPFQVRVKISGPAFNLAHVGYGVSQVLPIIVDSLREKEGTTFLIQQPEVHLHPRAQAELASFLAVLAKQQNKRFLIETHSDHIVDRIRMDVRDQDDLTQDDVSILYFEREDGGVQVHSLELDPFGNILEQPGGYRRFFLEEERQLLGG